MMFRELLQKYIAGNATLQEQAQVEEEIEKFEALNEYLTDQFEAAELPEVEDQQVQKAARRGRQKIFLTAFVGAALAVAVIFGAAWCADRYFYYDPTHGSLQEAYGADGNFFADICVLTELTSPGYRAMGAEAEHTGLGAYQLSVMRNDPQGEWETLRGTLVRGEVDEGFLESLWSFPPANAFGYATGRIVTVTEDGKEITTQPAEEQTYYLEGLRALPEAAWGSLYVTFPQPLTLEETAKRQDRYPELNFQYGAVAGSDQWGQTLGFQLNGSGTSRPEQLLAQYPAIAPEGTTLSNLERAAYWQEHYLALLEYLSGREGFLETFANVNGISSQTVQKEAERARKEGVQILGICVEGPAKQLVDFLEQEETASRFVADIWLSLAR